MDTQRTQLPLTLLKFAVVSAQYGHGKMFQMRRQVAAPLALNQGSVPSESAVPDASGHPDTLEVAIVDASTNKLVPCQTLFSPG